MHTNRLMSLADTYDHLPADTATMYKLHGEGARTALKAGGRIRVLTTFPDATELV